MTTLRSCLVAVVDAQDAEVGGGSLNCRGVCLALVMAWVASRLTEFTAPSAVPAFAPPRHVRGHLTTTPTPSLMSGEGGRIVPGEWQMDMEISGPAEAPFVFAAQRVATRILTPLERRHVPNQTSAWP